MIQSNYYRKIGCEVAFTEFQDGDQCTVKGVYSEEANAELDKHLRDKSHYFNLGGKGVRTSDKEAMQSLYNLTLCLPDDESKMSDPKF